jgi:hypothetical protein
MIEPGGQEVAAVTGEQVAKREPEDIRRNRTERITAQLMGVMKPMGHRTIQDQSPQEMFDDLSKPTSLPGKPDPEALYGAFSPASGLRIGEVFSRIVATPPDPDTSLDIKPAIIEVQQKLHLTEAQMHDHLAGVTGAQIEELADVIERSGLPLRFSATDEELMYELSVASGRKITDLDEVTLAKYTFPDDPETFSRATENCLFDLPVGNDHGQNFYPSVDRQKGRDQTRPEEESYYLTYNDISYATDAKDAKEKFETHIGYLHPNKQ